MGQIQLIASADGDRCAEYTAGMFEHEVYLVCINLLCCYDEVAFVLSVFVVYHDDEFSFFEVFYGFFYAIQSYVFHFLIDTLLYI